MKEEKGTFKRDKCLDEILISKYMHQQCSSAERKDIEAHLVKCPSCRHEIATLTTLKTDIQNEGKWEPLPDRLFKKGMEIITGMKRHKEGALEIRVQPGVANTVKNALVRKAPDRSQGTYAIEVTVTNTAAPTRQYEQAGITWYHGGKPVFKLVKELINGELFIIPGRKPMSAETVQLRLVVTAEGWTAQFRPNAEGEFQTAATGKLPAPGEDQVSIQCYNGPPDAEHWIRFDQFRILKMAE